MKSFFLAFAFLVLLPESLAAQCPGHSWIVELHSKRRGINCKSAGIEIENVFETIKIALQSNRNVEIADFGTFIVEKRRRRTRQVNSKSLVRVVKFKPAAGMVLGDSGS